MELLLLFLEKVCEAVFIGLFLIIAKQITTKKIIFILLLVSEYLILKNFISFNYLFQFLYLIIVFVTGKLLYKKKFQVIDLFLLSYSSIIIIFTSIITYIFFYLLTKEYFIALMVNRVILFLYLFTRKNNIRISYKEYVSNWNRKDGNKYKSITIRVLSLIVVNFMFWLINLGMIFSSFLR